MRAGGKTITEHERAREKKVNVRPLSPGPKAQAPLRIADAANTKLETAWASPHVAGEG